MEAAQYKHWLVGLMALTQPQLEDLASRIKILSKTSQKEFTGKQEFGDRVLQALCDVLRKQGVETPSVSVLRKSSAYVNSKGKFDDLAAFFEQISPAKIVQDQILKVGIECLYFDLVNWREIAISSHTLLQQIHRIPSVLNRHFPGYAQSGLLLKLVNRHESPS